MNFSSGCGGISTSRNEGKCQLFGVIDCPDFLVENLRAVRRPFSHGSVKIPADLLSPGR